MAGSNIFFTMAQIMCQEAFNTPAALMQGMNTSLQFMAKQSGHAALLASDSAARVAKTTGALLKPPTLTPKFKTTR